ncbi:MAG TPA: 23S rRNA (adenine(2503)-C(2))-methyltransferase RlmN [Solirubrobacteraceae bacterium]|nr:23S rRNA (adenine(2503)-C(2))-methyltransferase RlmN [Solirubrobacteraceae bacterium]
MDLQLLDQTLAGDGQPPFRARQVWEWAAKGAAGYEEMTNLPLALRERLREAVPFSSLDLRDERTARDGTVKALFHTADGRPLEAVLMRYHDGRRSICVSSQSGCPLTCKFCATGQMKFARNLTASEIVDQALCFRRMETPRRDIQSRLQKPNGALRAPISHCVFMGMGEPMLNLDAVLAACERLPDLGISNRHTAISTVGWIPGIERLAECDMPLRLALSLHAADEALRSELMPVNERYPLSDVIEACRAFYERKRRRVFVEYVMLAGVNDRYEQALALARLLGPRSTGEQARIFKVNLIPYNPTRGNPVPSVRSAGGADESKKDWHNPPSPSGPAGWAGVSEGDRYQSSSRESIAAFRRALEEHGVQATVRLTRGRDIDAACGQLAAHAA